MSREVQYDSLQSYGERQLNWVCRDPTNPDAEIPWEEPYGATDYAVACSYFSCYEDAQEVEVRWLPSGTWRRFFVRMRTIYTVHPKG